MLCDDMLQRPWPTRIVLAAGEDRQRVVVSDPEPVGREQRRYDSPTSSTDEEDAHVSLPAFWTQLTQKVRQDCF